MKSILKLEIIIISLIISNEGLYNNKIEILIEFKKNQISKSEIHEIEKRFDVQYEKLLFDNFHVIQ